MNDKFKAYAQTRATRQLAGDVANAIKVSYSDDPDDKKAAAEKAEWQTIETLLNTVECKLERMNLKQKKRAGKPAQHKGGAKDEAIRKTYKDDDGEGPTGVMPKLESIRPRADEVQGNRSGGHGHPVD